MADIPTTIAANVRQRLRQALLFEEDVLELVRRAPREPHPLHAGAFTVKGALPVPRLLDPETSELRSIELDVRSGDGGLEIFDVRGLRLLEE